MDYRHQLRARYLKKDCTYSLRKLKSLITNQINSKSMGIDSVLIRLYIKVCKFGKPSLQT